MHMVFKTLQTRAPLSSLMLPTNTLIAFSLTHSLRLSLKIIFAVKLFWILLIWNSQFFFRISTVLAWVCLFQTFLCFLTFLLVHFLPRWQAPCERKVGSIHFSIQGAPIGPRHHATDGTELTLIHLPPFNCSYLAEPH